MLQAIPPVSISENPSPEIWLQPRRRWARRLERLALLVERPVNRLTGSSQLNPFYHTGTIAVLLLLIVGGTGVYLFMFFQYGFEASYATVARLDGQVIARTMRAIHRYASGALVITTLLHAYRTLFMERFRGARWLAWVTGVVMTAIVWLAGVTGYWLLWDERAQMITQGVVDALNRVSSWGARLAGWLVSAEFSGKSWPILLLILLAHVLLFLLVALFFWLHIRRLNRPRWLPDTPWVIGASVVLLLLAALVPAEMLPPADPTRLPGSLRLDPVFLAYLPLGGRTWGWLLWLGLGLTVLWALALPWLSRRGEQPSSPVRILADACTGCTRCAQDCPYDALHMVERSDGSRHKLLAVADVARCVSCAICVGACDDYAITLGQTPPQALPWLTLARLRQAREAAPAQPVKVILTCERHAAQGAAPYLAGWENDGLGVVVVATPCVGAVLPQWLPDLLAAGATEVQLVGCPVNDCANREGNLWAEQRLTHERMPRLRAAYDHAPITAAWLPPDEFAQTLALTRPAPTEEDSAEPDFLSTRVMWRWLTPRNFLVGFFLLALVLLMQIWLTGIRYDPYPQRPARLQLISTHLGAPLARAVTPWPLDKTWTMQVDVDGQTWQTVDWSGAELTARVIPYYFEAPLSPGEHHIRWSLTAAPGRISLILAERHVLAAPGAIIRLSDGSLPDLAAVRAPDQ